VLPTDAKPSADEYLDFLCAGSRVPLDEVRRHPGGGVFAPAEPVLVQPARPGRDARMDVAPRAVIDQIHAIRAEAFSAGGGYGGDARFTHRLISRRMIELYNSTGDHLPRLTRRYPYNPAFLHPDDMAELAVRPGDPIRIDSDHDFVYAVAEPSPDVRRGAVSMAHARGGAPDGDADFRLRGSNTGRLVSCERDFEPVSGIPRQSAIPVNVRALSDAELGAIR
jgi:anaerobic selenocysteine-containing dehydrogenase